MFESSIFAAILLISHNILMIMILAPSILSADFANLQKDCEMINSSEADWFHIDIMDGVFVPNISFGFPVLKAIQKQAKKTMDVHLMIVNPDQYIQQFKDLGADYISVHIEACKHLHRSIQHIKNCGAKAGVALNPHTNVEQLRDVIADIDLVCLMSVNPGFGGQSFIPNTYNKIKALKHMIIESSSAALIEIDGGVTLDNAKSILDAGADVLVAGNTVFSAKDPVQMIQQLKQL
jgi:ribulose-phosphate 3-epimerase